MKRDATDRFIARHISSGDIVLTDDNDLTARCLNKGALAIDYRGRLIGRFPGSKGAGKAYVRHVKQTSPLVAEKKLSVEVFRESLLQAVG